MPSSNKTSNLRLNQWIETDKPTRSDFVSDNNIIDTQLGGHLLNAALHLTALEKERVSSPYYFRGIQGSGTSSRTVSFDFEPSLVICFAQDMAAAAGYFGFAVSGVGGTAGCSLFENTLTLLQGNVNSQVCNLNQSGVQYVIAAFR